MSDEVRVAIERSYQHAMPVQFTQLGQCLDEEILALVAAEDSDADQVSTDGPGRGRDLIDTGPGDVHLAGRDRVSGQYLLAAPFAGSDHACGRAEHDPFGALRAGIMACVQGGCQRHVQQHCHSYPAGVRQQLRGGRRGDEPVDQDGCTVGNGRNDAGQVGAGARVGYRPCRGDGRDQYIPSGFGHSGADVPVVDVAAGGLAGIVEPLGNYDMHPHDIPALQSARRARLGSRTAGPGSEECGSEEQLGPGEIGQFFLHGYANRLPRPAHDPLIYGGKMPHNGGSALR